MSAQLCHRVWTVENELRKPQNRDSKSDKNIKQNLWKLNTVEHLAKMNNELPNKPSLTMMAGSLIGLQLIWFLNRLLTILSLFWIVFNVAVLKTIQIINKKMSNRFKIRQLLHQLQAFCDPKSLLKRVWFQNYSFNFPSNALLLKVYQFPTLMWICDWVFKHYVTFSDKIKSVGIFLFFLLRKMQHICLKVPNQHYNLYNTSNKASI